MDSNKNSKVDQEIKKRIDNIYTIGLGIGAKAISSVLYEKMKPITPETSKEEMLKIINEMREFCTTGLNIDTSKLVETDNDNKGEKGNE